MQALAYYPFGDLRTNQSVTTPAVNVPYKYTGKELDASSNLYFFEARYYHAVFGRFISPDTIVPYPGDPQSLNRYAYARNNPLLYTDPTGHWFGIDDAIVIAVVVGATVGAVTSGIQSHWDPVATLTGAWIGGVAAGAGAGVASPIAASIGGVTGGIAGGAVAGGVSGALANAMGYNVNIGLAMASGAAAGGIVGGAGAQWGAGGAFLAATATGASAAAIRGADPGMGAIISGISSAFSLAITQGLQEQLVGRPLTGDEIRIALAVFGDKIDYSSVHVFASKYFFLQGNDFAMAPDGNIYWPGDTGNMATLDSGFFIHEMTHVLQYQHGVSVLGEGFLLQAGKYLSFTLYDPYSFSYDPGKSFISYNIEQQGDYARGIHYGLYPNKIDY